MTGKSNRSPYREIWNLERLPADNHCGNVCTWVALVDRVRQRRDRVGRRRESRVLDVAAVLCDCVAAGRVHGENAADAETGT